MARHIPGLAMCALSVLVVGLATQAGGCAEADDAAVKATPVTAAVSLRPFGQSGPTCPDELWVAPPDGRHQVVTISVVATEPPELEIPKPPCAKESFRGSLTFKVGALPAGHTIEIEFQTRHDGDGKPHRGPFMRNGRKDKYPQVGRCLIGANDSCVFDRHNPAIKSKEVFAYNVYLLDADGGLVGMKDPGIMVIDNP